MILLIPICLLLKTLYEVVPTDVCRNLDLHPVTLLWHDCGDVGTRALMEEEGHLGPQEETLLQPKTLMHR